MIYCDCRQYIVIIITSILLASCNYVEGSPSVAILGGEAYMRWTVSTTTIGNRVVLDPANNTIIGFTNGQARPIFVAPNVSYTGEISQGIMSFTLHGVKLANVGKYKYILPGNIEDGGQDLVIAGSPSVAILGGAAFMRWTVSTTTIGNRVVLDPANNTIIGFTNGQARPIFVAPNVNYTGEISQGIMSFTLHGVKLANVGKYKYILPGNIEDGGQDLVIAESPNITRITELSQPTVVGANSMLNCTAVSTSIPANHNLVMLSEWKKNGMNIVLGSKYNVIGTILAVNNLIRADGEDRFTCVAYEDPRKKSEESGGFTLNVLYGPDNVQITPTGDLTVDEEGPVNITCSAECNPVCESYRWQNGTDHTLVGSMQSLVMPLVRREQAGLYICNVTNDKILLSATVQKKVSVNYGPDDRNVSLSPSNTSYQLTELSRLDVKCSATCEPQCNYQWFGPLVSQNDNMGWLSISQIQRTQNGTFICTVTNPKVPGKSATAKFSVIVYYGPDSNGTTLSPSNRFYQLTESSSFTVQCTANCVPQCNYQWMGPGISQNDNHGLLSISEISRNQSGTFTCTVTNPKNSGKSVTANLSVIVYHALDVSYSGSSLTNSTVLLTCIASGEPSQYAFQEWIHKVGETEIRRLTGENTANTSTLTLPNISIKDMGTYVCTVDISVTGQNGQIKQTGHTDIFVHGTLFIENTNTMFIGMINKSARIEIPFYSNPSSTSVKFYRGSNTVVVTNTSDTLIFVSSFLNTFTFYGKEVLLNGQIAVLHFRMVKPTEYGEYTAVLFNDIGNASRRIVFSSGKPETPAKFHITDVQDKQVTLHWQSGDHKGFDQTFVVQISMDNITWTNASLLNAGKKEGWFSTTITGLKSNTVYYFRLYSFNVNGGSDFADIDFATRTLKESACSLDIGASIGIGFGGFFLGIIGTISVIIIIRKRITATPKFSSTSEADMSTDMQTYANTRVSSSPAPSLYEQLQQDLMEKPMYDHI